MGLYRQIKKYHLWIILATSLSGCRPHTATVDPYIPQEGDIAFQISEISEFVKAINDVSAQNDSIKFAHVGIVTIKNGSPCIIEAVPQGGVKYTPIETYLNEAVQIDGKPGIVIKRVNRDFPVTTSIAKAKSYLGQEYDWNFLPDNGKMYCSELIYESFTDFDGNRLFHASPMNFLDAEGNVPTYWRELFDSLNAEIPQGVMGTNPQSMANEAILTEVYRYF